jgi:hypothetical protein
VFRGPKGAWTEERQAGIPPLLSYRSHRVPFQRWVPCALLFCLVGACCPPLKTSYESPELTLETWQAQLCHDQPKGEYRCLSKSLQQLLGGFETYFAARQRLLNDDPVVGFFIQRVDLPGRAVESETSPDGRFHRFVFEESGQRFGIECVVETLVTFHLEDGTDLQHMLPREIDYYLDSQRKQQWVNIPKPLLSAGQQAAVRSITLEQQWKIASIDGLTALPRVDK